MQAAIDVGSNTIRMLIGDCRKGTIVPHSTHRKIVRLAGDFSVQTGLAETAMHRALTALKSFHDIISAQNISHVRVVGTAALRRAKNRQSFIDNVLSATGLEIEVIEGAEEALLTTMGILSVVDPVPDSIVIIDIGGGSTELACLIDGQIRFQESYPLGVVRLCEECSSASERQQQIDAVFDQFTKSLKMLGLADRQYQLIGTAGTITTLAAIHLQLDDYDASLINNHDLLIDWLEDLQQTLKLLSVPERETLTGMEPGRGDLILPGLQILLTLSRLLQLSSLKVADSGLLEGVMLGLTDS
ncbi:MAG: exopolyphosphatase [Desulfuromusa sp.]|nr:exopolyphosphatase [Desulfuromusa sp.]